MLGSRAGASAEADFLRDVAHGLYTVESMMLADIARAADLVEKSPISRWVLPMRVWSLWPSGLGSRGWQPLTRATSRS